MLLPSEYRVPNGCTRLTSNYNLFFIFIKEQDTNTVVNLQQISTRWLTNASVQGSQNHVIFQEMLHGHSLPWHAQPPLVPEPSHPWEHPLGLCAGARYTQVLPCQPCQRRVLLLLGSPQVQRVLVSFQWKILWLFGYVWRIEKEKSERKPSGSLILKCLLCMMSKWFRFGLFLQLRVPSEYRALPSE